MRNDEISKIECKRIVINNWFAYSIKKIFRTGLPWILLSIMVITIDRLSKLWVVEHLTFLEPLRVFSFLNLTLAYNRGAAFSFLHAASGWQNLFLGSLAFIVSALMIVWLAKTSRHAWLLNLALSLILGGAIGNAWDRILYGYVIDFFDFHWYGWHFAIFNLADSSISLGAILLIYYWIMCKNN